MKLKAINCENMGAILVHQIKPEGAPTDLVAEVHSGFEDAKHIAECVNSANEKRETWPEDVAANLDPTAIQGGVVGSQSKRIEVEQQVEPVVWMIEYVDHDGNTEREFNLIDEFSNGRCGGVPLYTRKQSASKSNTWPEDVAVNLEAIIEQRDVLQVRLDALKSAIHQTRMIGRHCLSEDDCINSGVDFSAYERGVLDAVNAMQSHFMAAINKSKGGGK